MAFHGRGKNRIQNSYSLCDAYGFYKASIEKGSVFDISFKVYKEIYVEYIKAMLDYIYEGGIFNMPYRMGNIGIIKKPIPLYNENRLSIDWGLTTKIGKRIYHLNEHSGGYRYRFHWERKRTDFKNMRSYMLIMVRTVKRTLARLIKYENRDYIEYSK